MRTKSKDMITVSRKKYEEMRETLEILSDPEAGIRILESIKQARRGKTITEKKFIEKFGL